MEKPPGEKVKTLLDQSNWKRECVKRACVNCRQTKKKCSEERPCARCVALEIECVDERKVVKQRKKRKPKTPKPSIEHQENSHVHTARHHNNIKKEMMEHMGILNLGPNCNGCDHSNHSNNSHKNRSNNVNFIPVIPSGSFPLPMPTANNIFNPGAIPLQVFNNFSSISNNSNGFPTFGLPFTTPMMQQVAQQTQQLQMQHNTQQQYHSPQQATQQLVVGLQKQLTDLKMENQALSSLNKSLDSQINQMRINIFNIKSELDLIRHENQKIGKIKETYGKSSSNDMALPGTSPITANSDCMLIQPISHSLPTGTTTDSMAESFLDLNFCSNLPPCAMNVIRDHVSQFSYRKPVDTDRFSLTNSPSAGSPSSASNSSDDVKQRDIAFNPFSIVFEDAGVGIVVSQACDDLSPNLPPDLDEDSVNGLFHRDFKIVACNDCFHNMLGLTREEVISNGWQGLMPKINKEQYQWYLFNLFNKDNFSVPNFPVVSKSGHILICFRSSNVLKDECHANPQFIVSHFYPLRLQSQHVKIEPIFL